ncbi:MAG: hypothetical protein JO217_08330 [Acidobacteriaceae bacterium]|nr:hypothetical protein [Acidobacteriaceae bacterium]
MNAAIQLCPDGCKINIDAGDFVFSTPVVINRIGLQIMGAGARATRLHFKGQGAAVDIRTNPFVIDSHNLLQGFSIDVESGNTALLTGDRRSHLSGSLYWLRQPVRYHRHSRPVIARLV